MSRTFLDQLGWVEQSANLKSTLRRAFVYASEQSHRQVTLEHTLLALTEDPEASDVLRACGVNLDSLRNAVAGFIGSHSDRVPLNEIAPPTPSEELLTIMNHASAATQDGERPFMDGSVVLAAMISEGKSPAAELLRVNGLSIDLPDRASGDVKPPAQEPAAPQKPAPRVDVASAKADQPAEKRKSSEDQSIDDMLAEVRSKIHKQEGVTDPLVTQTPRPNPPAGTSPRTQQPQQAAPGTGPAQQPRSSDAQTTAPVPSTPPTDFSVHPGPASAERDQRASVSQPAAGQPRRAQPGRESGPPGHPQAYPTRSTPMNGLPQNATAPITPPVARNGHPGANGAPQPTAPNGQHPVSHPMRPPAQGQARPGQPPASQMQQPAGMPGSAQPPGYPATPAGAKPPQPPVSQGSRPQSANAATEPEVEQVTLQQAKGSILQEAVPRKLKLDKIERAHIRIRRKDIEALASAFNMEEHGRPNGAKVVQALTIRLHAPGRSIRIEPESPETQWVDSGTGLFTDDELSWRWAVTGREPGNLKLKVEAATRTITPEGRLFEAVLPAQSFDVAVSRAWLPIVLRVAGGIAALGIAAALGAYGGQLGDMIGASISGLQR